MADNPKVLDTAQAAARLGVSAKTVIRLVSRGAFPHAYKLGSGARAHYAIPEPDVVAHMKKLASLPKGSKASSS
jgi:excisionase family DNA binding protein